MAEDYLDLGHTSRKSPKKNTSLPVNTNGDVLSGSQGTTSVSSSNTPLSTMQKSFDTRKRADLEIHYRDRDSSTRKVVVDVTNGSPDKKTNHKYAGLTSGVANYEASQKDDNYEQFTQFRNFKEVYINLV